MPKPTGLTPAGLNTATERTHPLTRRFLLALGFSLLVLAAVLALVYMRLHGQVSEQIRQDFSVSLEAKQRLLNQQLGEIHQQITLLSQLPPISGIKRAQDNNGVDPFDNTHLQQWYNRLQTIFIAFARTHPEVAQVRLLGVAENYRELVRVQNRHDAISATPWADLQAKGARDYVQNALQQPPGQVYLSPMELNREWGKIDFPAWPTYRAVLPIDDGQEEVYALLVINYRAEPLINTLTNNLRTDYAVLLNAQNQVLAHPNPAKAFRFEDNQPYHWQEDFGDAAPSLNREQWQQGANGLPYLARQFDFGPDANSRLTLVEVLRPAQLQERVVALFIDQALIILGFYLVGLAVAVLYQRILASHKELIATQAHYHTIINSSVDALIVVTPEGTIREWNQAATDLLGFSDTEAKSKNFAQWLLPPAQSANYQKAMLEVSQGANPKRFETANLQAKQGELDALISISAIKTKGKTVSQLVLVVRDIREEKSAHKALQNLSKELEAEVYERTRELVQARDQAVAATEHKNAFLADIAHELSTPINSLFTTLKLMRREAVNQRQRSFLDITETGVSALAHLIDDIFEFTQAETGTLATETNELDLTQLVHSVTSALAVTAHARQLEFIVDSAGISHQRINLDANRLRQLLNNALSHAIKKTKHGYVLVALATHDKSQNQDASGQIDVTITYTAEAAGNDAPGELSPAICQRLCELLGGTFTSQSQPGCHQIHLHIPMQPVTAITPPAIEMAQKHVVIWQANALSAQALARLFKQWRARVTLVAPSLDPTAHWPNAELIVLDDSWLHRATEQQLQLLKDLSQTTPVLLTQNLGDNPTDDLTLKDTGPRPAPPRKLGNLGKTLDKPFTRPALLDAISPWFNNNTQTHPTATGEAPISLMGRTLLVVDDHVIHREVLGGMLEAAGAYVLHAKDGQEAIDLLRFSVHTGENIDLVLMDCQMPVLNGLDATRAIRSGIAGESLCNLPIVAVTAGAMGGEQGACQQAGMNDYLNKPVDNNQLLKTVAENLANKNLIPPTPKPNLTPKAITQTGAASAQVTPIPTEINTGISRARRIARSNTAELWDKQAALSQAGQNLERLQRILTIFVESSPQALSNLRLAIQDADFETIKMSAHSLKGISTSIGSVPLAHAYADIENRAIKEDLNQVREACEKLEQLHQQLLSAISTELKRKQA